MAYRNENLIASANNLCLASDEVNKTEFRRSKSGSGSRRSNDYSRKTSSHGIGQPVPITKPISTRSFQESKSGPQSPKSKDHSQKTPSSNINQLVPNSISKSTPFLHELINSKSTKKDDASIDSSAATKEDRVTTELDSQIGSIATRHSSPAIFSITNSPGSTFSSSSPKEAAIDLGPAKVNLNARHFCGKRRYRMMPQPRRDSDGAL